MSSRTHSILLHMLEDAKDVLSFTEQVSTFDMFCGSSLYRKAIIMSIINIGELAKRLPQEFKSKYNHIPWRKISGMRDIAAHGYHSMDDEIIWDVAINAIPELLTFLQSVIHYYAL